MIRKFYAGLLTVSALKKNRNILILRVAVSVGILALLFWWLPTEKLLQAIRSVSGSIWLIAISGFLFGHFVSALKWRFLLGIVGTHISRLDAVRAHGAGLFANLCLPSIVGGDFVRAGIIVRKKGNIETIALGSLMDRINDTFALLLLASIAGFFLPTHSDVSFGNVLIIFSATLLVLVISLLVVIKLAPVDRLPPRISRIVIKLRSAIDLLLSAPHLALAGLTLSVGIQSAFIGLNILIASSMEIPSSIVLWFFAWPLAKLIALAPISLGGIGVRDSALAGLMVIFGIDASSVVAQSLSWQGVLIISGILSGILVTWLPENNNHK